MSTGTRGEMNEWPVVEVHLDDLVMAESIRRDGESPEHIEVLAAVPDDLPPIIVHRASMRPIDGNHRIRAARLRGATTITARFFEGDDTEAFILAVQLNVLHGLPLSLADRKRAAERIVLSHPQWSDRRVASLSGISPGTVAVIRHAAAGHAGAADSRIGQDGRVRPIDASTGRKRARELLLQDPTLSLRQVARLATISPETVRDVRNRLRREADPRMSPGGDLTQRDSVSASLTAPPNSEVIVRSLTSDPALRTSEVGRQVLRMLMLHNTVTSDWDGIVANVPLHCNEVVADLARQLATRWADLAGQAGAGAMPAAGAGTMPAARAGTMPAGRSMPRTA
ncbi:hypothetical protein Acy02nite_71140 [Actinoplanes cyaneus]|uniref:ParB-like N-terminal domain-containing protein n=2 Tax=Actinoplanes cyaneus TaxID=52696 RepID=A0A919M9A0_9ACTN|nr:Chromosome segregation protein Spo0J, contains ParB-like nuclease domain [Actinoplanes cyaneus]GID69233.1 hypothetical protein Acy02nite_71140 [Actinoplanes cyaneus]